MLKDHRNWITDFKPPFDPDLWPYHLLVQSKLKKISDLFCCIQIEHYQNKYVGFLHSHFKIQHMELGKVEKRVTEESLPRGRSNVYHRHT